MDEDAEEDLLAQILPVNKEERDESLFSLLIKRF